MPPIQRGAAVPAPPFFPSENLLKSPPAPGRYASLDDIPAYAEKPSPYAEALRCPKDGFVLNLAPAGAAAKAGAGGASGGAFFRRPVAAGGGAGVAASTAAAPPPPEEDDDALPDGWQALQDDEGDTFYYHTATGVSQWERPVKPRKAAVGAGAGGGGGGYRHSSFSAAQPAGGGAGRKSSFNAPAAGPVVKGANEVAHPQDPRAQIDHVRPVGDDPDAACERFEANPFKPDMCKRCRKKREKHAA